MEEKTRRPSEVARFLRRFETDQRHEVTNCLLVLGLHSFQHIGDDVADLDSLKQLVRRVKRASLTHVQSAPQPKVPTVGRHQSIERPSQKTQTITVQQQSEEEQRRVPNPKKKVPQPTPVIRRPPEAFFCPLTQSSSAPPTKKKDRAASAPKQRIPTRDRGHYPDYPAHRDSSEVRRFVQEERAKLRNQPPQVRNENVISRDRVDVPSVPSRYPVAAAVQQQQQRQPPAELNESAPHNNPHHRKSPNRKLSLESTEPDDTCAAAGLDAVFSFAHVSADRPPPPIIELHHLDSQTASTGGAVSRESPQSAYDFEFAKSTATECFIESPMNTDLNPRAVQQLKEFVSKTRGAKLTREELEQALGERITRAKQFPELYRALLVGYALGA